MTSPDDEFWRRPGGPYQPGPDGPSDWLDPSASVPPPPPPEYTGPPRAVRPTASVGWGPVIRPYEPPRPLPPQDHAELDAEEDRARAVTTGVGILTLVVLLLLLVLLVVRAGTLS